MIWRDEDGRTLADHPRPSVAVDVALLTLDDRGELAVVVHARPGPHRRGRWALPGTFLHEGERLRDAALRALRDKVGIHGRAPEQLAVFDAPDRDERGRVLSVAHVDLVPARRLTGMTGLLAEVRGDGVVVDGEPVTLAFDHDDVVRHALGHVRASYRDAPDPAGLAGDEFTLLELQQVHSAVLGEPLVKDTFRRRMLDRLAATGGVREGAVGKPARLYRRGRPSSGTRRAAADVDRA